MNTKNIIMTLLASVGVVVVMSVLMFRFQGSTQTEGVVVEKVEGESRNVTGAGEIVLVEFSDFQCPACRSVKLEVDKLLDKYDGKVKLVYRHYPLTSIHKYAELAARASEAAAKQDKFFEYYDVLFEKQSIWAAATDAEQLFVEYAGELGMDTAKFVLDMNSDEVERIVAKDNLEARKIGLSGTPSFFLNGELVNFSEIEARIETLTR